MNAQSLSSLTDAVLKRIFIELEASGRHVHITHAQALTLFGHDLTPLRPLSQPGQFLAQERVTLKGPKGTLHSVAVLGPTRPQAQVEISLTDGKQLGITPPIRPSGDVANTPGAILITERSAVALQEGVIAAQRHIHLTPETAARFGLQDKQSSVCRPSLPAHWYLMMFWSVSARILPIGCIWIMTKPTPVPCPPAT